MKPTDIVISLIKRYRIKKHNLKEYSYSKWTRKELLTLLKNNPEEPPLVIIEEFRDKITLFSKYNEDIFLTARDTCNNIIDCIVS